MASPESKADGKTQADVAPASYCADLRAEVHAELHAKPKARVHRAEWSKVLAGDPVEINPSVGSGYMCMTVKEWAARWKRNEDFPTCLHCGGTDTKEHYFTQTWCRGRRLWESEALCLECHQFSFRSYRDPDFKTPEEWEKQRWQGMLASGAAPS